MRVMRDGKVVDTVGTEVGTNGLISLMTGRTMMKTPGLKHIFEQIWADEKKHDVILLTVPSMKNEKGGWIL